LIADDIALTERAFLKASPSFEPKLRELRATWIEGQPSFFNVLSTLAYHLADGFEVGGSEETIRALAVVEDVLGEGSADAVFAATHGLLTDLQIALREKGIDPEVLAPNFGPNTKRWWNDLSKNWQGRVDW
jgi:hypothetical protein